MFGVYMPQNCYLALLEQGLAFFGEDRLATFLCSLARFDLANRGVRQSVQPHTFCAPLLVFDETLAQPHFAVVNCSDAVFSVFYSPFSTCSQNLAVMNFCVAALSIFSSDILTWSADSLYSVQWHIKSGECVKKNVRIMSTNFAKTLVWKHEYDVKLWRHKDRTPKTNGHHMPLNEPPMKIFCVRHCRAPIEVSARGPTQA